LFSLSLTEEQIALRTAVQAFADQRVRSALEAGELTPVTAQPLLAELHAMGLLAPAPAGHGIPDATSLFRAAEELAAVDPGLSYAVFGSAHAALVIGVTGSVSQRQALLPGLAGAAAPRLSLQLFEGFGRQPSEFETTVTATASGWRLSGRKIAVLWPGSADLTVVIARVAATGALCALAFDAATAAGSVERDDVTAGRVGLRAAHTGIVGYDQVPVPFSARLEGDGLATARAVSAARVTGAAVALGTARAALAYALRYAVERKAFGKAIADYQAVSRSPSPTSR
jgi:alkylation response protein AidB-like acyl-CoA dehydrogenase